MNSLLGLLSPKGWGQGPGGGKKEGIQLCPNDACCPMQVHPQYPDSQSKKDRCHIYWAQKCPNQDKPPKTACNKGHQSRCWAALCPTIQRHRGPRATLQMTEDWGGPIQSALSQQIDITGPDTHHKRMWWVSRLSSYCVLRLRIPSWLPSPNPSPNRPVPAWGPQTSHSAGLHRTCLFCPTNSLFPQIQLQCPSASSQEKQRHLLSQPELTNR